MRRAFTLIELLIVVAIIAILAAIAIPNFLEAQTRAKVSRAKNDMRTYATAIESYRTDNNGYPGCHTFGTPGLPLSQASNPANPKILERLSTPIAYISTAILPNVFNSARRISAASAMGIYTCNGAPGCEFDNPVEDVYRSYLYQCGSDIDRIAVMGSSVINPPPAENANKWIMHSPGSEQKYFNLGGVLANSSGAGASGSMFEDCLNLVYDPTNGTVSFGGLWRTGGNAKSDYAYQMFRAIELQR